MPSKWELELKRSVNLMGLLYDIVLENNLGK